MFSNSWHSVQSGEIEAGDPSCTKYGKEIFGPVDGDQFGTLSILQFTGAVGFLNIRFNMFPKEMTHCHIGQIRIICLDGQNTQDKKHHIRLIRLHPHSQPRLDSLGGSVHCRKFGD